MRVRSLSRTRVGLGIAALGISAVLSAQAAANPKGLGTEPCVPGPNELCLDGGRFAVTATFQTSGGPLMTANAVTLTDDTGYFWFFDSSNTEMVIKVLNGCAINQRYWAFLAGLTNVGVTTLVRDTQSGFSQTYVNNVGTAFPPIQDTNAFNSCP